jgi:WD40 repeat protein
LCATQHFSKPPNRKTTSCKLPVNSTVLTGGKEGTARLWDVATGKELQFFQGEGWITYATLSADNRSVPTVSTARTVQLWDEVSGKELQRFSLPWGGMVCG